MTKQYNLHNEITFSVKMTTDTTSTWWKMAKAYLESFCNRAETAMTLRNDWNGRK